MCAHCHSAGIVERKWGPRFTCFLSIAPLSPPPVKPKMKLVWRVASEERVHGFAFAQSCKLFPIRRTFSTAWRACRMRRNVRCFLWLCNVSYIPCVVSPLGGAPWTWVGILHLAGG